MKGIITIRIAEGWYHRILNSLSNELSDYYTERYNIECKIKEYGEVGAERFKDELEWIEVQIKDAELAFKSMNEGVTK